MYLPLGKIIDKRYKITSQLGKGGFAETYLAIDLINTKNNPCVVKKLQPQSSDSKVLEKARKLFKREAKFLQQLGNHEQIPQLLAYFEEEQEFYLVQQYIEGKTLEEELQANQGLSQEKVIKLLEEILNILRFVHNNKIIHRDIKPANLIRRNRDQKIVLIDFGAVKEKILTATSEPESQTDTKTCIGTLGYMPVEQSIGNPKFSSDIYALGIVGIQALIGLDPQQKTKQQKNQQSSDPRDWGWEKLAQNITPELIAILGKMTGYDYRNRYQSVDEVLTALKRIDSSASLTKITKLLKPKLIILNPIKSRFQLLILGVIILAIASISFFIKHSYNTSLLSFCESENKISCGEEILLIHDGFKSKGIKKFKNKNYKEAAFHFKQSWSENNDNENNDPESLIYQNNALLEIIPTKQVLTIAVVVPITSSKDTTVEGKLAQELLLGVAQAQTIFNCNLFDKKKNSNQDLPSLPCLEISQLKNFNKTVGLRVLIADDVNSLVEAQERAKSLGKQKEILGVIGHYASDTTVASVETYENNQLVLISPGSTTKYLECRRATKDFLLYKQKKDEQQKDFLDEHKPIQDCGENEKTWEYFFRTVPTTDIHAQHLVEYMKKEYLKEVSKPTAVVFYNPDSPYSKSLKEQFEHKFKAIEGEVKKNIDFSQQEFKAQNEINKIKKNYPEINAIALFPDGQTSHSFTNSLNLIKENQGENLIVSSWSLYNQRVLDKLSKSQLFKKFLLFAPLPECSSSKESVFPQNRDSGTKKEKISPRTDLAYDATKVLIKAIEQQLKNRNKITRNNIKESLADPNFNKDEETGRIQFTPNGDRKNFRGILIKVEEADNNTGLDFFPIAPFKKNNCNLD